MFSPAFLSLFMKIPLLCSLQISVKLTAKILSLSPQNVMAKRIAKRFAVTSSVVTIYDTIRYDIAQFIIQQVYRRRYESRRSSKPKLHLNKKKYMAKNDFQYGGWNYITPCSVACGSGIMTVNSPSGSTLQCDTWLWDDMPLNSPGGSTLQCDT